MSDFVQILVDMGFAEDKAKKAVEVTQSRGVEPAMEWILANSDEKSNENDHKRSNDEDSSKTMSNAEETNQKESVPKSYKCEDCGKLFKNVDAMEYHAAKTNHSNFSESTEEKKPLTEEEKKEQEALLMEKIKQKRMERVEREKREEREREKLRVQSGKDLLEARKRLEEQEMKELANARRKEKMEDKLARERVKAQIEADKKARREKFGGGASSSGASPSPSTQLSNNAPTALDSNNTVSSDQTAKKDYKESKIQIRLPAGKPMIQTFGVSEPLAAVRLFVELNRTDGVSGPFKLVSSFPKKIYEGDDYDMPLDALGLVPSAVLMVKQS